MRMRWDPFFYCTLYWFEHKMCKIIIPRGWVNDLDYLNEGLPFRKEEC